MPRKSAAALSVIAVDGRPKRLQAPSSLSEPERSIFNRIVANCDARHFRPSDELLLVRYAEASALCDLAADHLRTEGAVVGGKPSPWITVQEKSVRTMVALSMRLRLSPQSRADPKTIARQQVPPRRPPWEE